MNELTTHNDQFSRALATPAMNVGAVEIESQRAIAEVRTQVQLAKMFPRSISGAMTEFMDTCASPDFAASAFYSVPNRGSGPSIRFAEEIARCYGNFEFGHRELSRGNGKSEVEVYAWDKEKNNRSIRQITVEHVVDTRQGPKPCRDQSDIDNLIANKASKQVRGRILALVPKHMVQAGIEACKRTIAGDSERPMSVRIAGMAQAFASIGVNNKMLEAYLGHPVDNTTVDELADLTGIKNAIRDGAKPSEFFNTGEQAEGEQGAVAALQAAASSTRKPATAASPAAATKPTQKNREASKPAQAASNPVKDEEPVPKNMGASQEPPPAADPEPASSPAQEAAAPAGDEGEIF